MVDHHEELHIPFADDMATRQRWWMNMFTLSVIATLVAGAYTLWTFSRAEVYPMLVFGACAVLVCISHVRANSALARYILFTHTREALLGHHVQQWALRELARIRARGIDMNSPASVWEEELMKEMDIFDTAFLVLFRDNISLACAPDGSTRLQWLVEKDVGAASAVKVIRMLYKRTHGDTPVAVAI